MPRHAFLIQQFLHLKWCRIRSPSWNQRRSIWKLAPHWWVPALVPAFELLHLQSHTLTSQTTAIALFERGRVVALANYLMWPSLWRSVVALWINNVNKEALQLRHPIESPLAPRGLSADLGVNQGLADNVDCRGFMITTR